MIANAEIIRHHRAMGRSPRAFWHSLIHWIDGDVPWLQTQQLLAATPLILTIFIFPGPGTLATDIALCFWIVSSVIFCWRLTVYARRRRKVDRAIRRGMFKRLRSGRGLPRVGKR